MVQYVLTGYCAIVTRNSRTGRGGGIVRLYKQELVCYTVRSCVDSRKQCVKSSRLTKQESKQDGIHYTEIWERHRL